MPSLCQFCIQRTSFLRLPKYLNACHATCLGDGYGADGKLDLARKNVQKAVEVVTKIDDPSLGAYEEHLKRLIAKASASGKLGRPAAH
jgi:hypothetical protein